jgi:hypothetical protein
VGAVERVGEEAEPAEGDLGKELLEGADRVETKAEQRGLAERDGGVRVWDSEEDREVIDTRAGVQDLHDEPLRAGLVYELELAPLDDQERAWPALCRKSVSPGG